MAKGRAWRNRLLLLLAVSTLSLLIISGIMPNPFPGIWEWINRDRPIASEATWQHRLGGRVSAGEQAGDGLALGAGRQAQVRATASGELIAEWTADWLTVAGTGADAVTISGVTFSRGYEVRDPRSGAVRHRDEDAQAVWGFDRARLDLRCDGPRSCELRAYAPASDQPLWRAHLPGAGPGLVGPEPDFAMAQVSVPKRAQPRVGTPPPLPPLLGVPIDRQRIAVVHTRTGQVVEQPEPASDELVMVVGERVVRSVAARRDGVCQLAVSAYDPVNGQVAWGPRPYNLRTITGGGCEQQYAAVASGAALVAVEADGSELVVDANDGRVLWRGEPDERVQGLTEHLAVIKGEDPNVRYAVRLGRPDAPLWVRNVHADATLIVTDCGVVVADEEPSRLHVWHPADGLEIVTLRTSATLASCTPDGVVLTRGRSVALVPFEQPTGGGQPVDGK